VERWERIRRAVRPLASGMNSRLARRDMRLGLGCCLARTQATEPPET
jgi:hypothetical protein